MKKRKRIRITVSIDEKLVYWVDKLIKERLFASRAHAIELGLSALMDENHQHKTPPPPYVA